jgi:hypothetical protein
MPAYHLASGTPADLRAKPPASLRTSHFNHCFGVEPFVERLLSGFLLSDAPGMSFDSPLVPVELPLAPVLIEPVFGPTDLEGVGVGFELDAGFPPCGAVSAAKAGAIAKSAIAAEIAIIFFIKISFG